MKLMVSTTCSSLFISATVPAHALVGIDNSSAPPEGMSLGNIRDKSCMITWTDGNEGVSIFKRSLEKGGEGLHGGDVHKTGVPFPRLDFQGDRGVIFEWLWGYVGLQCYWFILDSPAFNSSAILVSSQLVCLRPINILPCTCFCPYYSFKIFLRLWLAQFPRLIL